MTIDKNKLENMSTKLTLQSLRDLAQIGLIEEERLIGAHPVINRYTFTPNFKKIVFEIDEFDDEILNLEVHQLDVIDTSNCKVTFSLGEKE